MERAILSSTSTVASLPYEQRKWMARDLNQGDLPDHPKGTTEPWYDSHICEMKDNKSNNTSKANKKAFVHFIGYPSDEDQWMNFVAGNLCEHNDPGYTWIFGGKGAWIRKEKKTKYKNGCFASVSVQDPETKSTMRTARKSAKRKRSRSTSERAPSESIPNAITELKGETPSPDKATSGPDKTTIGGKNKKKTPAASVSQLVQPVKLEGTRRIGLLAPICEQTVQLHRNRSKSEGKRKKATSEWSGSWGVRSC